MPARPKKKTAIPKKKTAAVKPIPAGFSTVTPYLTVSNASDAIEFYKRAFGAKEVQRNNAPDGKIMNARVKIGDSIVMLSDEFPGAVTKSPSTLGTTTVTLHIYSKNVDKLWEQAIGAGATVLMPIDNQFWGERYGQIKDPFGHQWSMSQQVRMSKEEREEKTKAAMEMFSQQHAEAPPTGVG
jgi:PhnB protein